MTNLDGCNNHRIFCTLFYYFFKLFMLLNLLFYSNVLYSIQFRNGDTLNSYDKDAKISHNLTENGKEKTYKKSFVSISNESNSNEYQSAIKYPNLQTESNSFQTQNTSMDSGSLAKYSQLQEKQIQYQNNDKYINNNEINSNYSINHTNINEISSKSNKSESKSHNLSLKMEEKEIKKEIKKEKHTHFRYPNNNINDNNRINQYSKFEKFLIKLAMSHKKYERIPLPNSSRIKSEKNHNPLRNQSPNVSDTPSDRRSIQYDAEHSVSRKGLKMALDRRYSVLESEVHQSFSFSSGSSLAGSSVSNLQKLVDSIDQKSHLKDERLSFRTDNDGKVKAGIDTILIVF